jgi:hypothetical protein
MRFWIKRGGLPLTLGLLVTLVGCGSAGGDSTTIASAPAPNSPVAVISPAPTASTSPSATSSSSNPAASPVTATVPAQSTTPAPNAASTGTVSNGNLAFADGFALKNASCLNPVLISTNGQLANATWVKCTTSGIALSVAVDLVQNKITVRYGDSIVGQHEFESNVGIALAPITAASNRIVFNQIVLTKQSAKAFAGLGGALPTAPTTITVSGDLAL